jgi:hypothetical protein
VEDIELFKHGCHVIAVVGKAGLKFDDIDSITKRVIGSTGVI